jgi:hypothetical protein
MERIAAVALFMHNFIALSDGAVKLTTSPATTGTDEVSGTRKLPDT